MLECVFILPKIFPVRSQPSTPSLGHLLFCCLIDVTPWLIHVNLWQNPLQCCEVISLHFQSKWKKNRWYLSFLVFHVSEIILYAVFCASLFHLAWNLSMLLYKLSFIGEGLMWSWRSTTLAIWCEVPTHWKSPWCWERLRAKGEVGGRGWGGWMASLTRWTWIWASSESWWRKGKPSVLLSTGLQSQTRLSDEQQVVFLFYCWVVFHCMDM